jgi:hypothetical protein
MRKMKNWNLLLFVLALGFFACNEDMDDINIDDEMNGTSTTTDFLNLETTATSLYEDVDVLMDESTDFVFGSFAANGRGFFRNRGNWRDRGFGDCATVENDTINNIVTIDFGDGCAGKGGRTRSGIMVITYGGERGEVGAFRSVTFENFFIDSVQVEGTKTHTISAVDADGNITTTMTLTGGQLTFPDGSTSTREAEKVRFRFLGASIEDSYTTVDGFASGTDLEGNSYSMNIDETILFQGGCLEQGNGFVPVSGVKSIKKGDDEIIIDYGDGSCDNIATVTINGVTEEIELKMKRRRSVQG